MNAPARPGYQDLTPARVLDALDAVGLRPDGRLLQLNSYENRVHQAFLEDGRAVVTKFYRPGRWSDAQILEEHAFALELVEAEVPVVAPLALPDLQTPGLQLLSPGAGTATLARWQVDGSEHRFSVSPRCAGREPELEQPDTLVRLGRFIGRLHAVGRRRPFSQRITLDPRTDGPAAIERVLALDMLTPHERDPWIDAARRALALAGAAFDAMQPLQRLRLHGDCHLGNVLWRDGPHVVDLDDACNGPAVQDLWMLVSGDATTMQAQLRLLLEGYDDFAELDPRELRLIEPLRTLRMVRHSAWLAERWIDPAFPAAFPFFGSAAYWSQQTTQLREQIESMSDTP